MRAITLFATYCLLSFCYSPSTNADIASEHPQLRSFRSSLESPVHEKRSELHWKPHVLQEEASPPVPEMDSISEIQEALSDEVRDVGGSQPAGEEGDGLPVEVLRAIEAKLDWEETKQLYFTSDEVFSPEYGSDPRDEIRHLRKIAGKSGPLPRLSGWNETFCGRKRQPWKGQEQIQEVRRNWKIFGVEENQGQPNGEENGTRDGEKSELLKLIPPAMLIGSSKDLGGIDQDKFSINPSCQDITLLPSFTLLAPPKAVLNTEKTPAAPPLIVDLSSQSDMITKILSELYSIRNITPSKFRRLTYNCSFPIPEWATLICAIPKLSFGLCNEKDELPCKTYIKHVGSPELELQTNGPNPICLIKKNGVIDGGTYSDHRTSGLVDVRWGEGCDVSYRFADLQKADAVIFNADIFADLYTHQYEWIDPTNWTFILRPSVRRSRNQLWSISMHGEASTTYPYVEDPDFLKHFDYSSGHDRRFFQFHAPSYSASKRNAHLFTSANSKNLHIIPKFSSYPSDPAPIVLVNYRCDIPSYREEYVKELMKYIQVDTVGNCDTDGNMEEWPEPVRKLGEVEDTGDANEINSQAAKRRKIIQGYKFKLVIESSICFDYVTEKFYDALQMESTVPIYLGAPNIDDYSPIPLGASHPPAYISAVDFASPKDLADHVYALLRDPTLYQSHFQWKRGAETDRAAEPEDVLKDSGLWREMETLETSEGFGCEICWRVKVSKCLFESR